MADAIDPENLPELHPGDLRPGDVLLSRGGTRTSDLICLIDRGDYSHASLWDGANVLEATGGNVGKVRESTLSALCGKARYVHAFRPTWSDEHGGSRTLGAGGLSPEPLLEVARSYVDQRYSMGQLYTIGTLVALGRLTGHPSAQVIFRNIGRELAEALRSYQDLGEEDRPMICSHFVSRCFWEADPSDARTYSLWTVYKPNALMRDAPSRDAVGAALAPLSDEERKHLDELERECRRLLLRQDTRLAPTEFAPSPGSSTTRALGAKPKLVRAGSRELPATCVTPGDLQESPTLRRIGSVVA